MSKTGRPRMIIRSVEGAGCGESGNGESMLDSRSGSGEAIDARRPPRNFVKIGHRESDLLLPSYSHQSVLPMLVLGRGGRGGWVQLVLVVCVNRRAEKCCRRRYRFTRSHAPDLPSLSSSSTPTTQHHLHTHRPFENEPSFPRRRPISQPSTPGWATSIAQGPEGLNAQMTFDIRSCWINGIIP